MDLSSTDIWGERLASVYNPALEELETFSKAFSNTLVGLNITRNLSAEEQTRINILHAGRLWLQRADRNETAVDEAKRKTTLAINFVREANILATAGKRVIGETKVARHFPQAARRPEIEKRYKALDADQLAELAAAHTPNS